MNYDHFSEGSENDIEYPGSERVKLVLLYCRKICVSKRGLITSRNLLLLLERMKGDCSENICCGLAYG